MAQIPGKTTLEEDEITVFADGNDYLRVARDVGPTNKKISSTNLKIDMIGTESDTLDAGGEILVSNTTPINLITLDTFAAAASDDLVVINVSASMIGQQITLQAADSTHTVVIKDGAGIRCAGGADFSLDHINDKWFGIVVAVNAVDEISRSDNS